MVIHPVDSFFGFWETLIAIGREHSIAAIQSFPPFAVNHRDDAWSVSMTVFGDTTPRFEGNPAHTQCITFQSNRPLKGFFWEFLKKANGDALVIFGDVGRLNSFRLAAEELHLSSSAISHQVRQLEDFVGQKLFDRGPTGVRLTSTGQEYLSNIGPVLDELSHATNSVRKTVKSRMVTLQCSPGFASRWILPRLTRLRRVLSDVSLSLSTNPTEKRPDVEISCGYGFPSGEEYETFMTTQRAPVCSAQYLRDNGPIQYPSDLSDHFLLHEYQRDEWEFWLSTAAPEISGITKAMWFDDAYSATLAAESGVGVVLGHLALIKNELRSGKLVRLFEQAVPQSTIFTLRMKQNWQADPVLATLRNWLLLESST